MSTKQQQESVFLVEYSNSKHPIYLSLLILIVYPQILISSPISHLSYPHPSSFPLLSSLPSPSPLLSPSYPYYSEYFYFQVIRMIRNQGISRGGFRGTYSLNLFVGIGCLRVLAYPINSIQAYSINFLSFHYQFLPPNSILTKLN